MLVEIHQKTPSRRVAIGETVKVLSTGQVGEVTGYVSGQWVVDINGTPVRVVESQLQVREVLYG